MKYGITLHVLGFQDIIAINESEFVRVRDARANLYQALFLEEKLDLVIANYFEFEQELLTVAARTAIYSDQDQYSMSHDRHTISRRIANLLTTGRMYTDQLIQHMTNIYGRSSSEVAATQVELSAQYDQHLGYRTVEALRNFVQHRGFPIQGLKMSMSRIDHEGSDATFRYRTIPLISTESLADDGTFKATVLKELEAVSRKGWVDARPLIREYMESIGYVNEQTRARLLNDVAAWEGQIEYVISRAQAQFGEGVFLGGLVIFSEDENRQRPEVHDISRLVIERRRALQSKNQNHGNLRLSYVSNAFENDDA